MLRPDEEANVATTTPAADTTVHLGNPVAHLAPSNGGSPGPQSPPLESERYLQWLIKISFCLFTSFKTS